MGRFEHSNREVLALSICRDVAVFVVHKGSLEGGVASAYEEQRQDLQERLQMCTTALERGIPHATIGSCVSDSFLVGSGWPPCPPGSLRSL